MRDREGIFHATKKLNWCDPFWQGMSESRVINFSTWPKSDVLWSLFPILEFPVWNHRTISNKQKSQYPKSTITNLLTRDCTSGKHCRSWVELGVISNQTNWPDNGLKQACHLIPAWVLTPGNSLLAPSHRVKVHESTIKMSIIPNCLSRPLGPIMVVPSCINNSLRACLGSLEAKILSNKLI